MQVKNKILDDIAKTATGLAGSFTNVKGEIDVAIQSHLEKIMADMDIVSREEFTVVKKMATKAREENEALKKRIEQLENK